MSKSLKKIPAEVLIMELVGVNDMIDNIECFGSQDLLRAEQLTRELERRGYTVEKKTVTYVRS